MFEQALLIAFVFTAFIVGLAILIWQAGVMRYDIRAARQEHQIRAHPNSRQYRPRPLMTIVVSTRNNERTIRDCLESITRAAYRKVEVIVVDGASGDNTKKIVRDFIKAHPKQPIRLVAQKTGNKSPNNAVKRYASGEFILSLPATSRLQRNTLHEALYCLQSDPNTDGVVLAQALQPTLHVAGLLHKYQNFMSQRAQKFADVTRIKTYSHENMLVRRTVFFASPTRLRYASSATVWAQPVESFMQLLKHSYARQVTALSSVRAESNSKLWQGIAWLAQSLAKLAVVLTPILTAYFIYLATQLHQPTLLILTWATLALVFCLAIWDSNQLKFYQKLIYTIGLPVTYIWLLALSVIQAFAATRSLAPSSGRIRL